MLNISESKGKPLEAMNQYIDNLINVQGQLLSRIGAVEHKIKDQEKEIADFRQFIEAVIQREKEEAEQEDDYEDERPPLTQAQSGYKTLKKPYN